MRQIKKAGALFCVFLFLFSLKSYGQATAGFLFTLPSNLSICGDAQVFTVKVYNKSSIYTLKSNYLTVSMPTGMQYVKSTVSGGGAADYSIGNLQRPVFSMNDIKPKDTATVTLKAIATCSMISFINGGGAVKDLARLDYNTGVDSTLSGSFTVGIPSISITSVTNQVFTGLIGDTFSRKITITNSGGSLKSFNYYLIKPKGLQLDTIFGKSKIISGDTFKISLVDVDFKKIGNKDALFDQSESITLRIHYTIISCNNLAGKDIVTWGCNGSNCQTYTASNNVIIKSLPPNLYFYPTGTQGSCYASTAANTQSITVINYGTGPANNVKLNLFFTANPGGGYYPYFYSRIDTGSVYLKYNSGAKKKIKVDSTIGNYGYSCLGYAPQGQFWVKLPIIKPSDTFTVIFDIYDCCIDQGYINGWGYGGTYYDQCNSTNYNISPGWGRVYTYQFFGTHTPNTTDLIIGDTVTYSLTNNLSYNTLLDGDGNHYIQYEFYMPKGAKVDKTSVYLINNTSTIKVTPDSVNIRGTVVHVTFAVPFPTGFSLNYSRLEFRVYTDTTKSGIKCGDIYNMTMNVHYLARIGCSCFPLLYTDNFNMKFNCVNPDKIGLVNTKFTFQRTSYGLPDNNDDGLPDASGSLNFSKIATGRAMDGDTVQGDFLGKVRTNSKHPSWKYGFIDFKFSDLYLGLLDTKLRVKDSSTGKTYTINTIPYTTSFNTVRFYFNPDTMRYYNSSIPKTFVFENADSIWITLRYKVNRNTSDIKYIGITDYFYFSDTASPTGVLDRYYVNNFPANITAIGFYYINWGTDYYNYQGCNSAYFSETFYLSVGACCSNYYGGNIFPYEYRYWSHLKNFKVLKPVGWELDSSLIYFYRTAGTGVYKTHLRHQYKPFKTIGDTLFFSGDSLFTLYGGTFPLPDDGWAVSFYGYFSPSCLTATSAYTPIYYFSKYHRTAYMQDDPGPGSTVTSDSVTADYVYYTRPVVSLFPALKTVNVNADTTSWTIYVSNSSAVALVNNAWLNIKSASGKITIDSVYLVKNKKKLKLLGNIFKIDTLNTSETKEYRIKAHIKSCTDDSIQLNFGWNCVGYPDSTNKNICTSQSESFYLNTVPQKPGFQMKLISSVDSAYLCDTVTYEIEVKNSQLGRAADADLYVYLPPGTHIVSTASMKYPKTGTYSTIGAPDSLGNYTWRYRASKYNSTIASKGFPGNYDTINNVFRLKFRITNDCNYLSGSWFDFQSAPIDACGNKGNIASLPSASLKIIGAKEPYPALVKLSGNTSLQGCSSNSTTLTVTVINAGIVNTDTGDYAYLYLPKGLSYVSGSFKGITNKPSSNTPIVLLLANQTRYGWKIPQGMTGGDSMTFSVGVHADSSNQCGTSTINILATTNKTLYCVSSKKNCIVQIQTGSLSKKLTISKPIISIANLKVTSAPASGGGEYLTATADITNSGDSIYANNKSVLKFYFDKDFNGLFTTPDTLIAVDTVKSAIPKNKTISIKYTFFAPAGRSCRIFARWDSLGTNCVCNTAMAFTKTIPFVNAGNDTNMCSGATIKIGKPGSSAYTYSWSPKTGISDTTLANPNLTLTNATASPVSYTYILVTNRGIGCKSQDTVKITVYPQLKAIAGSATAICLKDSVTIGGASSATGGNAPYTYKWTPATGLRSTSIANPKAKPIVTTTYKLSVTDAKGCTATDSIKVTVNPVPTASAGADVTICKKDTATLGGSPSASGGTSPFTYSWSPSTGLSSTSTSNPKAYPTTTTTYYLTITDAKGCKGYDTVVVNVNALATVNAGTDAAICKGDSVKIGGSTTASGTPGPYTYVWSPSTGLSSASIANPYAKPTGTTTYIVKVTDGRSCKNYDTVVITVNQLPKANAGTDKIICRRDTVGIGASPTATLGTSPYSYTWSPSTGLLSTSTANPKANPSSTTSYSLLVTDAKGCKSRDTVIVNVNPIATVNAGADKTLCKGDSAQISGSPTASGGTGTLSYNWTPATGLSSTSVANPFAKPGSTTTYIITVTDGNGCKNYDTVIITVNPLPVVNAGTDKTICKKDSITLGGSPTASSSTSPYIYAWSPASGLGSTSIANPKASPASTSTYALKVTDAKGCKNYDTVIVNVNPLPVVNAGADKTICNKDTVTLGGSPTASSSTSPYTYGWTPATGLSSTSIANPKAYPSVTTTYYLTVTDAKGCKNYDTVVITVNSLPVVSAGIDRAICKRDSVKIGGSPTASGGSGTYTYSWIPATGLSSASIANPYAKPTTTTTYYLTVTDAKGCKNYDTVIVTVNPLPTVSAGVDKIICRRDSITIGGSPTASGGTGTLSYSWSPSAGLSSATATDPKASPTATTTYIVTVTDSKGCKNYDTVIVTVNQLAIVNAGTDVTICNKDSVKIGGSPTASGGGGSFTYLWSPATGLSDKTIANPYAKPSSTTTYIVTVTDAKGCKNYDTVIVKVNPLPTVNAGTDKTICRKDSITLGGSPTASGSTSPYAYAWSPSGGLGSSSIANPKASPSATATYYLAVTDAKGCKNYDTVIVNVNPLPVVFAGNDKTICNKDTIVLGGSPTASSSTSPYTYSWSPATGLSSASVANPKAFPSSTTTYYLTVTDAKGCKNYDTVVITVNSLPVVSAGIDRTICKRDSVKIGGSPTASGGSGTYVYSWSPSTGLSSASIANPFAKPTATTTYILTVTDAKGCKNYDTVVVNVNPLPTINAGTDKTICRGDTATLGGSPTASGGTGTLSYSWSPATGLSSATATNPKAFPTATTTYILTVTDAKGCKNYDTVIVTVNQLVTVNAGADGTICNRDSIKLGGSPTVTSGTSPYTYLWSPATGLSSKSVANPYAKPSSTTTYILKITDAKGCTNSDTVKVSVNPLATINAGTDKTICRKDSITLGGSPTATGSTSPYTYAWSPSTALSSTSIANPKSSPSATTTYYLTVTDAKGCKNYDTVIVNVNPLPVVFAGNDKTICNRDTITLGGSPTASSSTSPYTYTWTPATGLSSTSTANPKAYPSITTTYYLTVTDAKGCKNYDTVVITVNPLATVYAGPDATICNKDSVKLGGSPTASGTTTPYTYSWSPATGLSNAGIANPYAKPSVTTTYILTVTDGKGCKNYDTVIVKVNPLPSLLLGGNITICYGNNTTLGASPTASGAKAPYTYVWSPSTGLSSTSASNPVASPKVTTTYKLVVTDANGCVSKDSVKVTVQPLPVFSAGKDDTLCKGDTITINATSTASYTYSWSPGKVMVDSTKLKPRAFPAKTTTFILTGKDVLGCTNYDTMNIVVRPKTPLSPPTIRCASILTDTSIQLTWDTIGTTTEFIRYNIYRSSGGAFSLVKTITNKGTSTYTNNGLSNALSNAYRYYITTTNYCSIEGASSDTLSTIILHTTQIGDKTLNLNWNAARRSGFTYRIEYNTGSGFSLYTTTTQTKYQIKSCSLNASYRISVVNPSCTMYSNTAGPNKLKDSVAPRIKEIITATVINTGSISVSFKASDSLDIKEYKVYRSDNGGAYTLMSTIANAGKATYTYTDNTVNAASHTYSYKVNATDTCGNTSVYSGIHTPVLLRGIAGNVMNYLRWKGYNGFTLDTVEIQRLNTGKWQHLAYGGLSDTAYTDTGLDCNHDYYYRIRSKEKAGNTALSYSDTIHLVPFDTIAPKQVNIRTASVLNANTIRITIDKVPDKDVNRYEVYASKNGASYIKVGTVLRPPSSTFTFDHTGISALTDTFSYQVKALDSCASNISKSSETHRAIQLNGTPGNYANSLKWSFYRGFKVKNYTVQRLNGSIWADLPGSLDSTKNQYTDSLIPCKQVKYYRIKGIELNGDNATVFSDTIALTPFDTVKPKTPVFQNLTVLNKTQIQLNWTKSTSNDVRNYVIYKKNSSGTFVKIATLGDINTFTDTGLVTDANSYCYKIQAMDSCANNLSAQSGAHCSELLQVVSNGCSRTNKLSWSAYVGWQGIKNVEVYRTVNGGTETLLATLGNTTSYQDTGLSYHKNYCYRVKAYDSLSANISWSNNFCHNVFFVDTPQITSVSKLNTSASSGNIKISWISQKATPHLAYYKLFYATSAAGPYTLLKNQIPIVQDTFIHTGVNTRVGDYYYYLQTVDSCSTASEVSVKHKTIDLTVSVGQLVHKLKWTAYQGWPIKYYITQRFINGVFVNIDTIKATDTSFRKFPAPCNSPVYYRMKAVSFAGYVSYSDTMGGQAIDTIPSNAPTMLNASIISGNVAVVDFIGADSSDTYGYSIQRSMDNGGFRNAGFVLYSGAGKHYTFYDTVNTLDKQLCYKVITLDSCLNSTESSVFCAIQLKGKNGNLSNYLNWHPFKGYALKEYDVLLYSGPGIWKKIRTIAKTDTSFFHDSLNCNVPRTYKIQGIAASGPLTTLSDSITLTPYDTIRPAAPTINYTSVLSNKTIYVSWNKSSSYIVKKYEVQYKTTGGSWTVDGVVDMQFNKVISGLNTFDSSYCVRVIAIDSCAANRSDPSGVHCVVHQSGLPKNLSNRLNWSSYSGFTVRKYKVERIIAGTWKTLDSVSAATNSYLDTALACNVPYYYRITAMSLNNGFASLSDTIKLTPFDTIKPPAPSIEYASVINGNSIYLQWKKSTSGVVKNYEVQYKTAKGSYTVYANYLQKYNTVITGLNTVDSTYSFQIIAIDSCASNRSKPSIVHTVVQVNGAGKNLSNLVTWSSYQGFTVRKYRVQRLVTGVWKTLDSVSAATNSYLDTALACNVPYFYRITALSTNNGFASLSDTIKLTPFDTIKPPATSIEYASVINGNSIYLQWKKSTSGVVKNYEVQYKTAKGSYTVYANYLQKYNTVITGLNTVDSTYSFQIIAIDSCASNRSKPSVVHTVVQVNGSGKNLSNLVTWSSYQGFTVRKYKVERIVAGAWKTLDSVSAASNSYLDTALACNVPYFYRITALSTNNGFASLSDTIKLTPFDTIKPPATSIEYASVINGNSIYLQWKNSTSGVVKNYEVQYKTAKGSYTVYANYLQKFNTIITGLNTVDSTYSFQIIAIDSCASNRSKPSVVHTVVQVNGSGKNLSNLVTWSSYQGFTVRKYKVERIVAGAWKTLDSVSAASNSYLDTALACNVPYFYRITALSTNNGFASLSDTIKLTPFDTIKPPATSIEYASVINGNSIYLQWKKSTSGVVKNYEVQYKTAKGSYTVYANYLQKYNTVITGLNTVDSTYSFQIVAIDSCAANRSKPSLVHTVVQVNGAGKNLSNLVTWSSYQGFTVRKYRVQRLVTGVWKTLDSVSAATNSYLDTALACNVPYYYRITALSTNNGFASLSDTIKLTPFDTIKPPATSIEYASDINGNSIYLQWKKSTSGVVKNYEVQYKTAKGVYTVYANYLQKYNTVITGLNTVDSTYSFQIVAIDSCAANRSKPSVVHTVVQMDGQPKDLSNLLTWSAYKGFSKIDKYYVYKWVAGKWQIIDSTSSSTINYTEKGLTCGVPYYYKVAARSGAFIALSDSIQLVPFDTIKPPAPQFYYASVQPDHSMKVAWNWKKASDVKYFEIYRSDNGGAFNKVGNTVYDSTFIDNTVDARRNSYRYYVIAIDSCGIKNRSLPSDTDKIINLKLATGGCIPLVKLSWTPYQELPQKTDLYEIYRNDGSGSFKLIKTVSSNTLNYTDTTVTIGPYYSYKIRAIDNQSGYSSYSDSLSAQPWRFPLTDTVIMLGTTVRSTGKFTGSIGLQWKQYPTSDTFARGFHLYRANHKSGPYKLIMSSSNLLLTSYIDSGFNTATDTNYYRLNTYNLCSLDGPNGSKTQAPVQLHARSLNLATTLDWKAYEGFSPATAYTLMRADDGGKFRPLVILNGNTTSYLDTQVRCKHLYSYRIETVDGSGFNSSSDTATVRAFDTIAPTRPPFHFASVDANNDKNVNIEFEDVTESNRAGYNVYRSGNGKAFTLVKTIYTLGSSPISFTESGLDLNDTAFNYYVTSFDSCGNQSKPSIINRVINLKAKAKSLANVLTWTRYLGWKDSLSYVIERHTPKTGWVQIAQLDSSTHTYNDSTKNCDTIYSYRILAKNAVNTYLSYSNTNRVTSFETDSPAAPGMKFVTVISTSSLHGKIKISWAASTANDVKYYNLYRFDPKSGLWFKVMSGKDTLEWIDSTLNTSGQTYDYRADAVDKCGNHSRGYSYIHTSILMNVAPANEFVQVRWSPYRGWKVKEYHIYRNNILYQVLDSTTRAFKDTGAICPNHYNYYVEAIADSSVQLSSVSNVQMAGPTDNTPPRVPHLKYATVSRPNTSVRIEWTKSTNVDVAGYYVFRYQNKTNYLPTLIKIIHNADSTIYEDSMGEIGQSYCYSVKSFDHCGNYGDYSNPGCIMYLSAKAYDLVDSMSWTPYTKWAFGVDNYKVYRRTDSTAYSVLNQNPANVLSFADTSFSFESSRYCYRVMATEKNGTDTSWSTEICLVQKPKTWIPNAFTPGAASPGLNDVFGPKGAFIKSYDMEIFNRWGQVVYRTHESKPWDGRFESKLVPEGFYVYKINIYGWDYKTYVHKGSFMLLR